MRIKNSEIILAIVLVVIIGTQHRSSARIVPIGHCPDSKNGHLATISDIGVTFCYLVKALGKGGTVHEAGQEACSRFSANIASFRDFQEMSYVRNWASSKRQSNNLLINYLLSNTTLQTNVTEYEPPCYLLRHGYMHPQKCEYLPVHYVLCKKAYQASRCNVILKRKKIVRRFMMKKKKMFKKYKKTMKKLVISSELPANPSTNLTAGEQVSPINLAQTTAANPVNVPAVKLAKQTSQ